MTYRPNAGGFHLRVAGCYNGWFLLYLILSLLVAVRIFFRSRPDLGLETLAPRQQVAVLKRKHPRLPLNLYDRFFWVTLYRFWSAWKMS
jgi:hypothetical protein